MRAVLRLLIPLFMPIPTVQAASSWTFQTAGQATHLLELYTSEGCSSCPPGERWLSSLHDKAGLWSAFVPVAFHVDYWDYLGWKDPYSAPSHSNRQQETARRWKSPSVYTPGFVLDREEFRERDVRRFEKTVPSSFTLLVQTQRDRLRLHTKLVFKDSVTQPKRQSFTFHAVLMGNHLKQKVIAGENVGKILIHDFAVLDWQKLRQSSSTWPASASFELKIPSDLAQADLSLAAWIEDETGAVVQATGGWLK